VDPLSTYNGGAGLPAPAVEQPGEDPDERGRAPVRRSHRRCPRGRAGRLHFHPRIGLLDHPSPHKDFRKVGGEEVDLHRQYQKQGARFEP
jgi:hypothetical protein